MVRAAPPEHFGWLTGDRLVTPAFRAIECARDSGEIVGMVGYDLWTASSVQMHVKLTRPALCRRLIRAAFFYPFVEVGLRVVLASIPSCNATCRRLVKGLGFKEVHRIAEAWSEGIDLVLYEMRRQDCKYIGGNDARI